MYMEYGWPICPSGGRYTANPTGRYPTSTTSGPRVGPMTPGSNRGGGRFPQEFPPPPPTPPSNCSSSSPTERMSHDEARANRLHSWNQSDCAPRHCSILLLGGAIMTLFV